MTGPEGSIYDQMTAAVVRVAGARYAAEGFAHRLAAAREEFDAKHAALIEDARVAKQAVADAEATAKALGAAHFLVTGEKAPVAGLTVKERTVLTYTDADAFEFAKRTGVGLVPETYDAKSIEKVAKAMPLPFVTITTEPMVTLASDLSAALAKVAA